MNKTFRNILLGAALAGVVAPAAAEAAQNNRGRGVRRAQPRRMARTPRPARSRNRQSQQLQMALGRARPQLRLEVEAYSEYMTEAIKANSTPPFQLLPKHSNARLNQTRQGSYHPSVVPRYDVSGLEADGSISFTALLPVSGHVGQAEAARYAKSNVYDVSVQYADGTRESFVVNTTGYVTEHDLDLKLKPGTNYVRFAPRGSGGVGGFQSGREIELNWTGN